MELNENQNTRNVTRNLFVTGSIVNSTDLELSEEQVCVMPVNEENFLKYVSQDMCVFSIMYGDTRVCPVFLLIVKYDSTRGKYVKLIDIGFLKDRDVQAVLTDFQNIIYNDDVIKLPVSEDHEDYKKKEFPIVTVDIEDGKVFDINALHDDIIEKKIDQNTRIDETGNLCKDVCIEIIKKYIVDPNKVKVVDHSKKDESNEEKHETNINRQKQNEKKFITEWLGEEKQKVNLDLSEKLESLVPFYNQISYYFSEDMYVCAMKVGDNRCYDCCILVIKYHQKQKYLRIINIPFLKENNVYFTLQDFQNIKYDDKDIQLKFLNTKDGFENKITIDEREYYYGRKQIDGLDMNDDEILDINELQIGVKKLQDHFVTEDFIKSYIVNKHAESDKKNPEKHTEGSVKIVNEGPYTNDGPYMINRDKKNENSKKVNRILIFCFGCAVVLLCVFIVFSDDKPVNEESLKNINDKSVLSE